MTAYSPRPLANGLVWLVLIVACACASPEQRKHALLADAKANVAAGRYREAVIQYRNAVALDAKYAEAHIGLAETYVRLGEVANAIPEFIRAADLSPGDQNLQLVAGHYLLTLRRPEEAAARARAVLTRNPQQVEAHVLLGNALSGLSDLERAVAEIEEALHLDPTRPGTLTTLGALELARGRRKEAEEAFKKAVTVDAKSSRTRLALGNFYLVTERHDLAEAEYRAALALNPRDPLANRAMAALSLSRGRVADAEEYLKRLVDQDRSASSVLSLADYYIAAGRARDAIARLEPLFRDQRTASLAGSRLAEAYAGAGDAARANAILEGLLQTDSNNTQARLIKAQLLVRDGKTDDALEQLQSAVESDPRSAPAHFALGRIYASRGDGMAAKKAFSEVLRLNPRALAARLELSRLQLVSGEPREAALSASEAMRAQPRNVAARLAMLRALVASKNWAAAERELSQMDSEHLGIPSVHVQRGLLLGQQRKYVEARAAFETALRLDAASTEALEGLTTLDVVTGHSVAARQRIDQRLAMTPSPSPELLMIAARTHAATGDSAGAEGLLRRAIDTEPAYLPAYASLGRLYVSEKKLDQARAEFDALARRHSRPAGALTMAGVILQVQGKQADARERFEQALAADPNAAVAANNLAWLKAEAGEDLDGALHLAQRASAALPQSAEVDDTLGWIYRKKKLTQLAVAALARAVERDPAQPVYRYHLGQAYVDAGDLVAARASLRRALELNTSFDSVDEARHLLARIEQEQRK